MKKILFNTLVALLCSVTIGFAQAKPYFIKTPLYPTEGEQRHRLLSFGWEFEPNEKCGCGTGDTIIVSLINAKIKVYHGHPEQTRDEIRKLLSELKGKGLMPVPQCYLYSIADRLGSVESSLYTNVCTIDTNYVGPANEYTFYRSKLRPEMTDNDTTNWPPIAKIENEWLHGIYGVRTFVAFGAVDKCKIIHDDLQGYYPKPEYQLKFALAVMPIQ